MTAVTELEPISVLQLDQLRQIVQTDFSSADKSHDYDHLQRVEKMAARLAAAEGGDEMICRAAALVHDYHRLDGNHGLDTTGEQGNFAVRNVLQSCDLDAHTMIWIESCVAFTDKYVISGDTLQPPSIEAAVVRDADNLDAMGAIGIARAFTFGAAIDEPMWAPNEEIRDGYDRGRAPSVIHHFYEKLLNLQDELITDSAQDIGEGRHRDMRQFVASFRAEWVAHQ